MESRVYYGEYSLKHWINLMLKRNIVLPEYQRSFVWDKKAVIKFIQSLKEGQFIQPVTIALYSCDGKEVNLLLDGQQRLTSVLLAYLGYMPDKSKFDSIKELVTGDDSVEDDADDPHGQKSIIGWTFEDMLDSDSKLNTQESIKQRIQQTDKYEVLSNEIECLDEFFENTFLGFSYIVPGKEAGPKDIQRFFSTLFRNMNYLGKKLSPLESRRSLYYLNQGLEGYFDGKTKDGKAILGGVKIMEQMQPCEIDVVRYLSVLSQYFITQDARKVLVGYSAYASRESYYADYVAYIVGLEQEDRADKFSGFSFVNAFGTADGWLGRFDKLQSTIEELKDSMGLGERYNEFPSWIDADYWFFGLIYCVLFKGADIDLERKEELKQEIRQEVENKKRDEPYYAKSPNRLGNLRERLQHSITMYERYEK